VPRYPKGIVHYGMRYVGDEELLLHGFVDTDWAGDASTRNNTFSYCFTLGSGMISWFSRKKETTVLSLAKEGNMTVSSTCCEAIWLCKLIV